jgi:hypothetical protein
VGGHVYVAGVEFGKDGTRNARLWIDGQTFPLQGVIETNQTFSFAYAVREAGGSHYVAGGAEDAAHNPHPVIWKDGVRHQMPGSFDCFRDFGFAQDGTIHALGINGNMYAISADLSSMAQTQRDAGSPQRVFVSGGDVYLAGYLDRDACYWKNGVRHEAERPAGAAWAEAGDIHVHEGRVYLTGRASYNNVGIRLETWIDGVHAPDRSSASASALLDLPTGLYVKNVPKTPATGVALSGADPLAVAVGSQAGLAAAALPADAGNRGILWKSSDPAVASVAPVGDGSAATVTGRAQGLATITATSVDGPWAARAVEVRTVAAQGVSVSPASMTLGRLRSGRAEAAVAPPDATDKAVVWASSDPAVATVRGSGLAATVRGAALGAATITAATEDGGHTAACAVTVVEPTDPAVYITGRFGLYVDGARDEAVGDNQAWETRIDGAGDVYTAGSRLGGGADPLPAPCLYVNGEPNILPTGRAGAEGGAYGLWLAGGRAYVAGYENGPDGDATHARLWIDGQPSPLHGTAEDGQRSSYAWAVRERDGDIYVAGGAQGENLGQRPVIWKNGQMHVMPGGFAYIRDIDFAADGTLYAFGDGAVYRVAADLSTMAQVPRDPGTALRMYVDGDDVYAVGQSGLDACYWKNGLRHDVGRPADVSYSQITSVHAHGGRLYMSGRSYVGYPDYYSRLELWIDGERIDDQRRPAFSTPVNGLTYASHILVKM